MKKMMEIILKCAVVLGLGAFLLIFPVGIIWMQLIPQHLSDIIVGYLASLVTVSGIIVFALFGTLTPENVQPYKFFLNYTTYSDYKAFLDSMLLNFGYVKKKNAKLEGNTEIELYLKQLSRNDFSCYALIRSSDVNANNVENIENNLTKLLRSTLKKKCNLDLTSLIIVDRVSPFLKKIINSNLKQERYMTKLPIIISFGSNKIFMAKQVNGVRIFAYEKMRKEAIKILNLKEEIKK